MSVVDGKVILITGATSGIGFETAKALPRSGGTMILVARNKQKAKKSVDKIIRSSGNRNVEFLLADLSSQIDIRNLVQQFKSRYERLDVLINNAGAKIVEQTFTEDGIETTFALNHLNYFLLTHLLMDRLRKAEKARIINVSSGSHGECKAINFDDLNGEKAYNGKMAYAQSKLANILFTYELARRVENTGITINAVNPGGTATNFARNNGFTHWLKHLAAHTISRDLRSPKKGAETSIYLATSPEVENISGKYYYEKKLIESSEASYDKDMANKLWDVSLKLTGFPKQ